MARKSRLPSCSMVDSLLGAAAGEETAAAAARRGPGRAGVATSSMCASQPIDEGWPDDTFALALCSAV